MAEVNEEFQFPLARKIAPEETVEILIVQVKTRDERSWVQVKAEDENECVVNVRAKTPEVKGNELILSLEMKKNQSM